jgi:hypothetical protein
MSTIREIEKKLEDLDRQRKELEKQRDDLLRKTLIACKGNIHGKGCGAALEIGELTYIQTHWYEEPHGCTGGDCWHQGEGEFDCPRCGLRNRLYDRKDYEELKHLFKDVKNEHKHDR